MSLPKEIELKIHGYRMNMISRRIKEFEKTSRFTMSVRRDHMIFMKYMKIDDVDFNRDSFILYCMRRSFGIVHDWQPGPDDDPQIEITDGSMEYKSFLIATIIKYCMPDDMKTVDTVNRTITIHRDVFGDIFDDSGSSDETVFDGYDEYSSD